jgi:gamma-glutamyltranspeptidase / glutathione hydrolase
MEYLMPLLHRPLLNWFGWVCLSLAAVPIAADQALLLPKGGAVVTDHPLASRMAADVLLRGGNALDAAVQASLALGVLEPQNSGLGGGALVLARFASGQSWVFDGRETAPALAGPAMYFRAGELVPALSREGALSVATPGYLAALYEAHKRGGLWRWRDLAKPVADLARQGVSVSPGLAQAAANLPAPYQGLTPGATLVQVDLANTLLVVADEGPNAFYRGDFARALAALMQEREGLVSRRDLEDYKGQVRRVWEASFQGYSLISPGMPLSASFRSLQILALLDAFPWPKLTDAEPWHLAAEAMTLAFNDRPYWLGDSDQVPVPPGFLAPLSTRQMAAQINRKKASQGNADWGLDLSQEAPGVLASTLVVDDQGNWVVILASLNQRFGSKLWVPGTGVVLNNSMSAFSVNPLITPQGSQANNIAPKKRPLWPVTAFMVVKNARPQLLISSGAGMRGAAEAAQVAAAYLALGQPLADAAARPRVFHTGPQQPLGLVGDWPEPLLKDLKERGHNTSPLAPKPHLRGIGWREGKWQTLYESP